MPEKVGIMLGSGFADFTAGAVPMTLDTAYGSPSAPLYDRELGGQHVLALARHGDTHTIPPHAINYRANIAAFKNQGVTAIVALNTVGVIGNLVGTGELGIPDQLIDYTWGRAHTFFDGSDEGVTHIDFTQPFSRSLRERLLRGAALAGVHCFDGGVYAATQGPRLETAAEVDRLERDGADYIGMTAMPEAALAAEIGIDYACLALVVNYAAGRSDTPIHDDVAANSLSAKSRALKVLDFIFAEESER